MYHCHCLSSSNCSKKLRICREELLPTSCGVWRKVMFSQASVCPQGRGVWYGRGCGIERLLYTTPLSILHPLYTTPHLQYGNTVNGAVGTHPTGMHSCNRFKTAQPSKKLQICSNETRMHSSMMPTARTLTVSGEGSALVRPGVCLLWGLSLPTF